jgi:hypothetical protein
MKQTSIGDALTERQYQLIAARARLLPLTAKDRLMADELIRSDPVAGRYATALRYRLKERAKDRLQSVLGASGSTGLPARSRMRADRPRIRFADGLNAVAGGNANPQFQHLLLTLRSKRSGQDLDVAWLDYSNKLGARRDAIEACDLIVFDATSFLAQRLGRQDRFAAEARAIAALYEVAWALYLGQRMIWVVPDNHAGLSAISRRRAGASDAAGRISEFIERRLQCLARTNQLPIFKMSGPSPEARLMPQDYRRLFKGIKGVVMFGFDDARWQLLNWAQNAGCRNAKARERKPAMTTRSVRRRVG